MQIEAPDAVILNVPDEAVLAIFPAVFIPELKVGACVNVLTPVNVWVMLVPTKVLLPFGNFHVSVWPVAICDTSKASFLV